MWGVVGGRHREENVFRENLSRLLCLGEGFVGVGGSGGGHVHIDELRQDGLEGGGGLRFLGSFSAGSALARPGRPPWGSCRVLPY